MARSTDPEKRDRILASARETFLEEGYEGARMTRIASGAGVAVGTLYLYFDSKEALARALTDDLFDRVFAAIDETLPRISGPEDVASLVDAALEVSVDERELFVSLEQVPAGPSAEIRGKFVVALSERLEEQMRRGVIQSHDPPVFADLLVSLFERAIYECLIWENTEMRRYRETLILIFQRILPA